MATIINAIKISLFNEEVLRDWHAETGLGPADHPLLQLNPKYFGFVHLKEEEAKAIDAYNLRDIGGNVTPIRKVA